MAFIVDKEELKPGLVIFRRTDVAHRNWYCRVKLPKADRYKTISLKTADKVTAREKAFDQDREVFFQLKHDLPVFNRPFSQVGKEYIAQQEERAKHGEVSKDRPKKLKAVINGALSDYVGTTQVHLIGQDRWEGYPAWRRENGTGRYMRTGMARREGKDGAPPTAMISDSTIRFEMSVFGCVMRYALSKRYIPASHKFENKPKLKVMRRDEFTLEEYRRLHTVGRAWVNEVRHSASNWYRPVAYNFILIMCNTGMRPSEAKNLRWRDVTTAKDREGRDMVVLFVQGKGKSRKLVAPASVGDYLERIKKVSRATKPEDRVFTTSNGKPANTLYQSLIEGLLERAGLREGQNGVPRTTYCFRHTYATFRLSEGIDVYFLAEQMGTSVRMIEEHYGHVNTIKHADRVLKGMTGWEPEGAPPEINEAYASGAKALAAKQPKLPRRAKR